MRRREPSQPESMAPEWLWRFRLEDWVPPDEYLPPDPAAPPGSEWMQRPITARRRWWKARAKWCADNGLSFAMTVLGWRKPTADEVAQGLVKSLPRPDWYANRFRQDVPHDASRAPDRLESE